MKKMTLIFFSLLSTMIASCTDAEFSSFTSLGDPARITCHSGGKVIYDGCSTGKVSSESHSDGYFFRDKATQRLVEVSGECFIDYNAPCPRETIRPSVSSLSSVINQILPQN